MKKITILLTSLLVCATCFAQVKTYDYPEGKDGLVVMNDFAVTADGQTVKTYQCEVNPHRRVQKASWCQFEAGSGTILTVVRRGEKIRQAVVRPLSKSIIHKQLNDSTIQFRIPAVQDNQGYALEVDINGDREHCLHIFVDGPEQETYAAPSPDSKIDINWKTENSHDVFVQNPRLIYFGPGLHKPHDLPSAEIKIPSGATVYLAPGAVVRARLIVDRAENVRIIGRGVLLSPLRGVEITYSKNVTIDGLTVINPQHYTVFGGQSENITVRNVRSFSRHPWSDGVDMMCCKNVLVEDVFLRNNDDAFAIYNHRWWYWGGTENIHIRRATIFNDLAHPFNIGSHGDDRSDDGELLHNVRIEDCDILSADCDGVMSISCGDKNRIEDIHFTDIRIEDVVKAGLFRYQVCFSEKYNRAPGNYIRDVWAKNIQFTGNESHLQPNIFQNYDYDHSISDLHFDNVRINGKRVEIDALAGKLDVPAQIEYCKGQARRSMQELSPVDYTRTPRNIGATETRWNLRNAKTADEWCSGFWPGILWMVGDTANAKRYTRELEFLAYQKVFDHDLGFQMIGSFLKGYEFLNSTFCDKADDRALSEHYRQVLLAAADTLATLFNPRVGTLLSWPRNVEMFKGHNTIIDNMINLELLLFSGKKENIDIALSHADTTMRYHFRPDGTVNHVAVYDPVSGRHIYNCTHQGLNDNSLWSRGQAWAIYGYTMVYRYIHDQKYLDFAQKVTDVMLSKLPADGIPYWDMYDPKAPDTYRDASAAAIIASALIELSRYVGGEKGSAYLNQAEKMLTTLSSDQYQCRVSKPAFLLHSVGNKPAGSEIDASINYADYYYIEALNRLVKKDKAKVAQVLFSDYSDPDVCKGKDGGYWLTASSFQCSPGLPILYSDDLGKWQLVNYAIDAVPVPEGEARTCTFEGGKPQAGDGVPHGCGVWAPSIRLHGDRYYIYWGDPDYGVWMTSTRDPRGKWDDPVLVLHGKGIIDPCPLWDDDGRVYLVNGWAASRSGFNSVLTLRELSADGRRVIGSPVLVYDGQVEGNHTVEGPKFYKHDGFYYILAPAGGVEKGWQLALRSQNVYGPYESHKVFNSNGIHQGGMVGDAFIAFRDNGLYGRVLHHLDVEWKDGWPMMSERPLSWPASLAVSSSERQRYQWHSNYRDNFGFPIDSGMRIYGYNQPKGYTNCWEVPNLYLKKFEGETFTDTLSIVVTATADGHESGVIVMGRDYCRLSLLFKGGKFHLRQSVCRSADKGKKESSATNIAVIPARKYNAGARDNYECRLSVIVRCDKEGDCSFAYSTDGKAFTWLPTHFKARQGKWIGAKYGIFSLSPEAVNKGWCDIIFE